MAGRRYDDYDHERFERPRRRTRPRTKERPTYEDATSATVVTVDRGRFTLLVDDEQGPRTVTAMKSRPLGRKGVVVGDEVYGRGTGSVAERAVAPVDHLVVEQHQPTLPHEHVLRAEIAVHQREAARPILLEQSGQKRPRCGDHR